MKRPVCPALRGARVSGRFAMVTPLHGCASVARHKGEVVLEGFLPRGETAVH